MTQHPNQHELSRHSWSDPGRFRDKPVHKDYDPRRDAMLCASIILFIIGAAACGYLSYKTDIIQQIVPRPTATPAPIIFDKDCRPVKAGDTASQLAEQIGNSHGVSGKDAIDLSAKANSLQGNIIPGLHVVCVSGDPEGVSPTVERAGK